MNLNPVGWASSSLRLVARLFNSGVNSTVPVTAISEAPIGVANADIALVAKGTGATLAQVPDGTVAGGNKRGTRATDLQKSRTAATQVASGNQSAIGGGAENSATGNYATVAGGGINNNTGLFATIGGGYFNQVAGQYASILGGDSNTASSNYSFVGGGQSNVAQTNSHATVCGGSSNTASGLYSFVGGGLSNTASGTLSVIAGGAYGTTRSITGYQVFPACSAPISTAFGITQSALLLLARETLSNTSTVLTSNSSGASTNNQIILPNNAAYSFSGEVIAGVTGGGDTARWTINGAIKRGANAASTAMVGTPTVTMTHNDSGAAAWTVAVTADTTNGGITVTVTGAVSTAIRWVCKINTTEMTY